MELLYKRTRESDKLAYYSNGNMSYNSKAAGSSTKTYVKFIEKPLKKYNTMNDANCELKIDREKRILVNASRSR